MDASGSHDANRRYYDAFAAGYENHRGDNDPGGYHALLDELETDFVKRYARAGDILEVGCGTGLVLAKLASFAQSARGVDLSPGMLELARGRGLNVVEGSATSLPFPDASFDVTCSFKVLAHVPAIEEALAEMTRVTRPGGYVIAEFYNPYSLRGLVKKYGPAGTIAQGTREDAVFTRFDSPRRVASLTPPGTEFVDSRGIRIVTPAAAFMRPRALRWGLRFLERHLADSQLKRFGGFYVAAFRKLS